MAQSHGEGEEEKGLMAQGEGGRGKGKRTHKPSYRLRLPIRIHNSASFIADHVIVPKPRLRIDRFADGAQNGQRFPRISLDKSVPVFHQSSNSRRRRVEFGNRILVDDGPESARIRVQWNALELKRRTRIIEAMRRSGEPRPLGPGKHTVLTMTLVAPLASGP